MDAVHQPLNLGTIIRNITGTFLPMNLTGSLNPIPHALRLAPR
jgi:hypothetical protein